jgi:hypothetical protein
VITTGDGADPSQFYDQVLDPLPALSDYNMGVTKEHYQKLQKFVNENNVALFVRISDKTSLRLIQDGNFACKSVDVHDKSSNWGPQRGTVPVDPFFNKKLGGTGDGPSMLTPRPNILEVRASDISHAKQHDEKNELKTGVSAKPLVVSTALFDEYVANNEVYPCDSAGESASGAAGADAADASAGGSAEASSPCGDNLCYHARAPANADAGKETVQAANSLSFCMAPDATGKAYTVSWYHKEHSRGGAPTPLYVWSYGKDGQHAPVTGDYDLWMVAPHKDTNLANKGKTVGIRDRLLYLTTLMEKSIRGGTSTMTGLIDDLLNGPDSHNLNALLGRRDKPVFHHGAEAQNHYFLQPLDDVVAAIVPENKDLQYSADGAPVKSGPCSHAQLARLLAALVKHGYFVQVNPLMKASVFHDPHFAGKSMSSRYEEALKEHPECEANPQCQYVQDMKRAHYAKTLEMRQFTFRLARNVGTEWWNEAIHKVDTSEDRRTADCVPPHIIDMQKDSGQKKDNVSPSGTDKWGAVEFVNADGDVVGGFGHKKPASELSSVCGQNMELCYARQYCRRMFPQDLDALSGGIAFNNEAMYSQFVVLNRLISARQSFHLARVMVRRNLKRLGKLQDGGGEVASFSDTALRENLRNEVETVLTMKAAHSKKERAKFEDCLKAALQASRSGATGGDADADMAKAYSDSSVVTQEATSMEAADTVCHGQLQKFTLYWRALSRGNNAQDKVFNEDEFLTFERIQSNRRRSSHAPPVRQMTQALD